MNDRSPTQSRVIQAATPFARACLALAITACTASVGCAEGEAPATAVVTALDSNVQNGAYTLSIEVVGHPEARVLTLRNPDRVVLDMQNTVSSVPAASVGVEGAISAIRDGLISSTGYRIVLQTQKVSKASLTEQSAYGRTTYQLRIVDADSKEAALTDRNQTLPGAIATKADRPADEQTRYKVVVDPGHGGIDTGATGQDGTLEKKLNLEFGRALRDALVKLGDVDVVMTRDADVFIPLAERSATARRERADLLISLHADSIRYKALRGATVYTLSEKASDALSGEIAAGENASDRFADADWNRDAPDIHNILVDFVRRETDGFSRHIAASLVLEFGRNDIRLINNPQRSAGFRVLMAPDVPSVLLEIGYLSNREDEKLLVSGEWQAKAAAAIASAAGQFLRSRSAIADMVKK